MTFFLFPLSSSSFLHFLTTIFFYWPSYLQGPTSYACPPHASHRPSYHLDALALSFPLKS